MEVRTFNAKQALYLMCDSMVSERHLADEVGELVGYVNEKLGRYQNHLKNEQERKVEQMPPEKRTELVEKRKQQEVDRKTRVAKAAKDRALAAARRAKELATQLVDSQAVDE